MYSVCLNRHLHQSVSLTSLKKCTLKNPPIRIKFQPSFFQTQQIQAVAIVPAFIAYTLHYTRTSEAVVQQARIKKVEPPGDLGSKTTLKHSQPSKVHWLLIISESVLKYSRSLSLPSHLRTWTDLWVELCCQVNTLILLFSGAEWLPLAHRCRLYLDWRRRKHGVRTTTNLRGGRAGAAWTILQQRISASSFYCVLRISVYQISSLHHLLYVPNPLHLNSADEVIKGAMR